MRKPQLGSPWWLAIPSSCSSGVGFDLHICALFQVFALVACFNASDGIIVTTLRLSPLLVTYN